jgi:hypothetical protein
MVVKNKRNRRRSSKRKYSRKKKVSRKRKSKKRSSRKRKSKKKTRRTSRIRKQRGGSAPPMRSMTGRLFERSPAEAAGDWERSMNYTAAEAVAHSSTKKEKDKAKKVISDLIENAVKDVKFPLENSAERKRVKFLLNLIIKDKWGREIWDANKTTFKTEWQLQLSPYSESIEYSLPPAARASAPSAVPPKKRGLLGRLFRRGGGGSSKESSSEG